MFNAAVEYRYQFQMAGGASGVGVNPPLRAPVVPPNYVPPSGSPGNYPFTPGNADLALFIRNDGGDVALWRWGAQPIGNGGMALSPGGAVVIEPGDPGLSSGAISYQGGPLYLAWGTLIAETGAPYR